MVILPRFDIDLDVVGSLKPGHPIHFTVRGKAHYATRDAEVRLVLPEVAAAERSGWDLVVVPDTGPPPHLNVRKAFGAGEAFRERTTVTIPEPGYYSAIATVIQHSDDRTDAARHVVGTGEGREIWLWIDEHGGRITERFDPTLFPTGKRRVHGPLGSESKPPRLRDGDAVITCSISPAGTLTVSSTGCPPPPDSSFFYPPPANATARVSVKYRDQGSGDTMRPLVGAWVSWSVFNTVTGAEVAQAGGYTSASGESPVIDCVGPTAERRLQATVYTDSREVEVKDYTSTNADRTQAGQYLGPCGGSNPISAYSPQAHVFMNLSKTFGEHRRVFGEPPMKMKAGIYPLSTYGSRYDPGADHIRLEPSFSWSQIWGEHGALVAAHEWGHLWQHKYLFLPGYPNGMARFLTDPCSGPHPPGEYTNFGCAFSEAFADWYGVVVRESDVPIWKRDLEENRAHLTLCGQKCTDDGSVVQGAISAFLWDVVDPAYNEEHDRLQKTPYSVTEAMRTCEITTDGNTWKAYTGIDHLIRCMERRFPYKVTLQRSPSATDTVTVRFFNTRASSGWANESRGFPVANLSEDFRRAWLVNLYSKRSVVGMRPIIGAVQPNGSLNPPPEEEPDPSCGTWAGCPQ